jgi:hypothetical protein
VKLTRVPRTSPRTRFSEAELRSLYEQQLLSTRAIARSHNCHKSAVLTALIAYGIARRPSRREPVYPRQNFSGHALEKAYMVGCRDGDLDLHKANHRETSKTIIVACASSKLEQIDLIRSLFEPYGHVHISSTPRQSVITCFLDLSFSFLLHKSECVPMWALDDRQCFAAYFAGYVDAEGCIGVKRTTNSSSLVVRSGDLGILQSCRAKLLELGIDCPPLTVVRSAGQRDGANGPIYRRDYWCLAVYQQVALDRVFELISPFMRHPKRRRGMQRAWNNVYERTRLKQKNQPCLI